MDKRRVVTHTEEEVFQYSKMVDASGPLTGYGKGKVLRVSL